METNVKCTFKVQLIFILVYIVICKVYGAQETCPPLSCLSSSFYVRLGDLKSELQQIIDDQADVITELRDQLQNQVMS